ncbi:MAG: HAMP domain-containing protein [Alphaproteobacteria bacterium]|nr:HAMP domain-containing protein [Alphaproteobacteria bacterium]
MRLPLPPQSHVVKRVLPRTLLGRSLLIILIPLVIVLAVAVQIFYGSHLNLVSRRFTASVAGEIAMVVDGLQRFQRPADRDWILRTAFEELDLLARFEPGARLDGGGKPTIDEELVGALHDRVGRPFRLEAGPDDQSVRIRVQLPGGVLDVLAPRKRLYTGTLVLFLSWVLGSALLLFSIAALFMRNQVRAIRRLADAAEAFGMGRDQGPIKPEGASEVRQAGTAFNRMQERIRRFLQQRTEMLAGVSHDLRTPLTRLRLALAMLPAGRELSDDVAAMSADVEEMERLIESYLAFARGERVEQARPTDLAVVLEEVAAGARRTGAEVQVEAPSALVLPLRADAVRRALTNLVDNARRHARRIALGAMQQDDRVVQVTVDDDGPGIPPDARESLFRPFASGAAGGTGLGLTIARDIVRAHGGDIVLEDSPLGGLRARVQLPV